MESEKKHFVIGSRQSQLALIQTNIVKDALEQAHPDCTFEIKSMATKGDKVLDVALSKIGDKGVFTHELETGILEGSIDFAVHSLKDLPTTLPEKMIIGAVTKREIEGDVAIFRKTIGQKSLAELPKGSVVGSSSLRRIAQLKRAYPQLIFKDVRGNLNTRFNKLDDPSFGYDALILAHSGINRMGHQFSERISVVLDEIFWAPGQGALAVETREDNHAALKILKSLNDNASYITCSCERAFLDALGGGCQVPLGVKSKLSEDGNTIELHGRVLTLDGSNQVEGEISGPASEPFDVGRKLAKQLIEKGADKILSEVRGKHE